jgi:short-subunit dehydrogenase
LLPRLAESGGHVLIVASLAAFYPMPLFAVYAASKSFLLHWGLALRHEVEALGVSVTVLTPGGINTSEEIREKNRSQGLPGRLSSKEPEEVAAIALRGAFKGRAVVVPGAFNRMLLRLGTLLTKNATAGAIYQRWLRTLGKVEGSADAAWFIRKRDAA